MAPSLISRINQTTHLTPVILSGAPERFVCYQDHWRGVEESRERVPYHAVSGSSHEDAIAAPCVLDAFLKHALMLASLLLWASWPLANAATPPRWESDIEKRYAFQTFDRPIRALWMKQQGLVFLTPERLLIYQVNPASARVKLAPRGSSGGAGNFVLILKILNARDGNVLHSLELTTSGEVSRVLATHSGGFVVQAGAAVYAYSPSFEQ